MQSIFYKKILKKIENFREDFILFGFYIAITNALMPIIAVLPHKFSNALQTVKHKKVLQYLKIKYNTNFIEEKSNDTDLESTKKLPIWVCWLQGEDNMPEVPKICYKSIKKNSNGHPVILITLDNYNEYINIPNFILKKYEKKEIKDAHFSDIIRTTLLADIGGCWIDSTVLLTNKLNEKIFDYPLFSIKFKPSKFYITGNKWSNFFLVSQKNSILFNFTKNFLYNYIKNEKKIIDYFLMDYIIYLGYINNSEIQKQIDSISLNNENIHELEKIINQPYQDGKYNELTKNTSIFKLSWKSNKFEYTKDNQLTYWGNIKQIINE